MKTTRSVVLTHVVNPHQFYFKYLDECINSEFTKFDIKLQEYALELHADARYEEGHSPIESELVLFYHIIFNKWIRARVICIDEQYTLWCVDNGYVYMVFTKKHMLRFFVFRVLAKCTKKVILPLATRLHDDMKLVHLGGLSLLPTEKVNLDLLIFGNIHNQLFVCRHLTMIHRKLKYSILKNGTMKW